VTRSSGCGEVSRSKLTLHEANGLSLSVNNPLMKTARGLGLLRRFGDFLRGIFKQRGWYEDRRILQITASIAVAVVVTVLIIWGLLWAWHRIKRCRLAIGFAGLTVGFWGYSLHFAA
jgi:hypothetical protein